MRVQHLPFPKGPEETVAKIEEIRPLLNKFYAETSQGNADHLSSEMLTMFWHQRLNEYVELLNDQNERVGLLMVSTYFDEPKAESRMIVGLAYVEPEYRKQGWFKKMIEHLSVVSKARGYSHITLNAPIDQSLNWFGKPTEILYTREL